VYRNYPPQTAPFTQNAPMPLNTPNQILISGGGIAGLTLAYWLLRAGMTPVIVEKSPHLRTGGYMIDFWGLGYDVCARMGLRERLLEIGYDISELRLVDAKGHRKTALRTDSIRKALGGRYVSLLRGELVLELQRALAGNVEILFGDCVKTLTHVDTGIVVEFERAPARPFRAVVGADGVHSNIRRLVFGADPLYECPLGYHVAAFIVENYPHRDECVYVSRTLPGRQVVRCTLRDGRCVFFIVMAAELAEGGALESPAEQKSSIRDVITAMQWEAPEIAAALEKSAGLYVDRVSQIRMPGWSRGRIVLVGDAAYCPSFLAGEGASFGMAGAYILAGELAASRGNIESAFLLYEQRLKPFLDRKQRAALRLGSWFAPRTRPGLLIRNVLTRLAATAALSSFILRPMVSDMLVLPDYRWPLVSLQ
jgi:2-polyprenyl-6-methoxyphenol hydroxylase-like FAD-dependent oxidoreductase